MSEDRDTSFFVYIFVPVLLLVLLADPSLIYAIYSLYVLCVCVWGGGGGLMLSE